MTAPANRVLRERFLLLQENLASCLRLDRSIHHEGKKGTASEAGWRAMLADYLPRRYSVAEAFVIDSRGGQSRQLDLVLHDRQFSPFLFNQNDALYIPAESVYAVFEVKQKLDLSTLRDAGAKAASVRNLHRTSAPIPWAGGREKPRPAIPILAGLLCFDSRWSPPFGDPLCAALAESTPPERLDLVCALTQGSFEVSYPDGSSPQIDLSAPDTALIFFFLRLLERLQAVATVPAMEIREYARALES